MADFPSSAGRTNCARPSLCTFSPISVRPPPRRAGSRLWKRRREATDMRGMKTVFIGCPRRRLATARAGARHFLRCGHPGHGAAARVAGVPWPRSRLPTRSRQAGPPPPKAGRRHAGFHARSVLAATVLVSWRGQSSALTVAGLRGPWRLLRKACPRNAPLPPTKGRCFRALARPRHCQSARRRPRAQLRGSRARQTVGACPVTRRNTRLNCESDWNPASKAASLIRLCGLSSRFLIFSTRMRAT
jgi:hypothetical protein